MKNKYISFLDNFLTFTFSALSVVSICLLFITYSHQLLASAIGLLLLSLAYSPLIKKGFIFRILLSFVTLLVVW